MMRDAILFKGMAAHTFRQSLLGVIRSDTNTCVNNENESLWLKHLFGVLLLEV